MDPLLPTVSLRSPVSRSLPIFYDCLNCPSYCCTYPRIPVTRRDIQRLARHFDISEEQARRRFTKPGWHSRERVLRHQKDEIFGTACRFLDTETRLCTVHAFRPSVCRGHPDGRHCGYYTFLMSERRDQRDPTLAARAYNLPGEHPRLDERPAKGRSKAKRGTSKNGRSKNGTRRSGSDRRATTASGGQATTASGGQAATASGEKRKKAAGKKR